MTFQPEEFDAQAQRESKIVREALRHYPTLQAAPDFDARVIDRVLDVQQMPQHRWKDVAPTRRERHRLWIAQRVVRLEKTLRITPRAFVVLCAIVALVLFTVALRALLGTMQSGARSSQTPTELRSRNAESSPIFTAPRKNSSR